MMIYTGIVENRIDDPKKLGRCRVRILGLHSPDKVELPTEDLPWAVVMQPTDSAAVSGIGRSPTGLVEGTVVIVIFRDEYKQQPIIIGTVPGIPEPFADQEVKPFDTTESKLFETDSVPEPERTDGKISPPVSEIKKPNKALKVSSDAYTFIRKEGLCSSKEPGKNEYVGVDEYNNILNNEKFYAYESGGKWLIGWSSDKLADGSPVDTNTVISKEEVESAMKARADEIGEQIKAKLRAPVTQSMFDAMVAIMYYSGDSFLNSKIINAVNACEFKQAASHILVFANDTGKLNDRRVREKNFFSKDGYPSKDLQSVEEAPIDEEVTTSDATQNPVVRLKPDETTGGSQTSSRKVNGFRDPQGVYPKIFNEPDTHRLARHEQIDKTIVYVKESARVQGVVSGGRGKWSQPKVPYNAKYPYNHVFATESGHVQEFDDTPGSERIHTYHRSGTFSEIDANGTRVNRIVGDDFEILERNGNVLIRGSLNVTIIGNQNIRVENDANIDVLGNINMTVGGDFNLGATGNINLGAGGQIMMNASSLISGDAGQIHWNSGKGYGVPLGKGSAGGVPEFSTLQVQTRATELQATYETPEDGDPTEFNQKLEEAGLENNESSQDESTTEIKDETPTRKPDPIPVSCDNIPEDSPVNLSYQLSKNFKLRDLNGDRINQRPAVAITKAEIVCNLKKLAENVLEPIKKRFPSMIITSGYRNRGNNPNSDHLKGCAADFVIQGFNKADHYKAALEIVKIVPAWTQIILESRGDTVWIHVSYNTSRGLNMQKFTMINDKRVSPSLNEIIPV